MLAKGRLLTTLILLAAVSFYLYESKKSVTSIAETRIAKYQPKVYDSPQLATSIDIPEASEPTVAQKPQPKAEKKQPEIAEKKPPAQPIQTTIETSVQTPQKRTVQVKNVITKKMLSYKHWSGTYKPNVFVLKVNDTRIDQGEEKAIDVTDNTLHVRYDYSFMNGYRKGAKNITFELDQDAQTASLSFSWKGDWHITIDTAAPQSIEPAEFDA